MGKKDLFDEENEGQHEAERLNVNQAFAKRFEVSGPCHRLSFVLNLMDNQLPNFLFILSIFKIDI